MKKQVLFFVMMLLPLVAIAHNIEVANADGVTIYYNYNYNNNGKELAVTYRGNESNVYKYKGNIVIPEEVTYKNNTYKVTSIGNFAFVNCPSLTSVTIPNSVKSIGQYAFGGCYGLTSIEIPNSVTSIGVFAFSGCSGLTSVTIGNSVTSISKEVFSYCSRLTSVTIPNSVKSIGQYAFGDCTGLTSVTISNSVTNIGREAFNGCTGLISIEIPNSVTSIDIQAFMNCSGLTSVTIGNSLTSIGREAFKGCSNLKKVIIPDIAAWCSVTFASYDDNPLAIATHLYSDEKTEITDLVIPNGVTKIGDAAFCYCLSLTSVIIPNSVTSIGSYAFYEADIPTVISLLENPFTIKGKTSFNRTFSLNTFDNAKLYVPKGTINKYKATTGWKDFVNIVEGVPDGINGIHLDSNKAIPIYDLNGRPVTNPQKGINIIDGKKVMVR